MKREYVIFDMDGVLLDSEVDAFLFLQKKLEKRNIFISKEELLSKVGKNSRQIAKEIIESHNLEETVEEFLLKNRQEGNYYADFPDLKEMDGLDGFVHELKKRGIRLAVVSSTGAVGVVTALNRLDLMKRIDVIVSGDMVKKPKPNPEGYLKAAHWLGAKSEECVVFEDSPIGIQAALNAGMRVVGFKGSVLKQDTSAADLEFFSYKQCREQVDIILQNE